jgi:hypothetical protein
MWVVTDVPEEPVGSVFRFEMRAVGFSKTLMNTNPYSFITQ